MEESTNQDQVIQTERTVPYWKFIMHGPDGANYLNESVFIGLEPGKKIVIKWSSVFEDPKMVAAIRHIAEPGAEQNLDRLDLHLRGELN